MTVRTWRKPSGWRRSPQVTFVKTVRVFDFSTFSDPTELGAALIQVGDYIERRLVLASGSLEVTRGIVESHTEGPAELDGKLRFDLVDALKETRTLRLHPGDRVLVRRPDHG
jgi:hypothetical protein